MMPDVALFVSHFGAGLYATNLLLPAYLGKEIEKAVFQSNLRVSLEIK